MNLPPIIPSVWTASQRDVAVLSAWPVVHVAGGRLRTLAEFVQPLRASGKRLWVHPDRIQGLARDEEAIHYLSEVVAPEVFVTSSLNTAQIIRSAGLCLCLRMFLYDTQSLESGLRAVERLRPQIVCVMPALVYEAVQRDFAASGATLTTAGLVRTAEHRDRLRALGVPVELGSPALW